MRLAVIIGHTKKDKGFYSPHLRKTEYEFYSEIAMKLKGFADIFFHDPTISSYTQRCIEISKRIGNDYDLVIALHFNAFDGSAEGTECFYWHTNERTKEIATNLCKQYSERFGSVNRGAKPYKVTNNKLPRGAGEVYYPKIDAILFEPLFGDNEKDCEKFCTSEFVKLLCDLKNNLLYWQCSFFS